MTDPNNLTTPDELVQQWESAFRAIKSSNQSYVEYMLDQAARWGADQELEACCQWLESTDLQHRMLTPQETAELLRAARRPKQPSLKEQALKALEHLSGWDGDADIIRRALEQLPDAPAVTPPAAAADRPLWVEMRDVYSDPSRIHWSGHGFARELRVVADWLEATGSRDLAFGVARLRAEAERAEAP